MKPNYNIGDEVFFMYKDSVRNNPITEIHICQSSVSYKVKVGGDCDEDFYEWKMNYELFPTKQKLLESL